MCYICALIFAHTINIHEHPVRYNANFRIRIKFFPTQKAGKERAYPAGKDGIPMTAKEYQQWNKSVSPKSKSYINIPVAFVVGGLICVLGQVVMNFCLNAGIDKDIASATASISLVFLSALLTGLNIYDNIAKHAGAGTLVPITGFANSMVAPAMEFKAEGLILGLGAKMFSIAGPVIVYGISASVIYGIILFLTRA